MERRAACRHRREAGPPDQVCPEPRRLRPRRTGLRRDRRTMVRDRRPDERGTELARDGGRSRGREALPRHGTHKHDPRPGKDPDRVIRARPMTGGYMRVTGRLVITLTIT